MTRGDSPLAGDDPLEYARSPRAAGHNSGRLNSEPSLVARTALTVQDIDRTDNGDPTFSAANADGHSIANDVANRTLVWVKNGGGSPITVTFVTNETRDGLAVADLAITVTNAEDRVIGPFPPTHYNQSDDTVHVDFSAVTTVTVAAFKLAST